MENKNVFVALALSMAVLLFWGAFVETPKKVEEKSFQENLQKETESSSNTIVPSVNETLESKTISREDSINLTKRIKIENESIVGSISLKGGLIYDVSFKKHKQNLVNNKNIVF